MDHAPYSAGGTRRDRPPPQRERDGYRDRERLPNHRRPSFEDDRYARRPNYYASSVPPEQRDQRDQRPSFTQQRDARSVRDPRDRDQHSSRQESVYSERDSREERSRARGDSFSSSTTKDYNTNGRENSPPMSARWKSATSQPFRKGPRTPERSFERRTDDLGRRTSNGGRPRSLSPVNQGYTNGGARRSSEYPSGSISARDGMGMGERYDRERDREREREPQRGRGYADYGDRFSSREPWYSNRPVQRYSDDDRPSASSSNSCNTANTALPPPPPPANTVIGKRTRAHEQMEERESQQQQQQQQQARSRGPPAYAQSRPNNLQFGSGSERRSSVSRGSEPYSASDRMSNGWPADDRSTSSRQYDNERTSNTATPALPREQDGPRTPPPRKPAVLPADADADDEEEEGEVSDHNDTSPRLPTQAKTKEVQVKQEMLENSLAARISTAPSTSISEKNSEESGSRMSRGGRTPSPRPSRTPAEQPSSSKSQDVQTMAAVEAPRLRSQQQESPRAPFSSSSSASKRTDPPPSPRSLNPESRPPNTNAITNTSPNTPPLPKVNLNLTNPSSNIIRQRLSDASIPTSPRAMRREQELHLTSTSASSSTRSLAERLGQPPIPASFQARQSPSPRLSSRSLHINENTRVPVERRVTSPSLPIFNNSTSSPSFDKDQQPSTRSLLERIEPAINRPTLALQETIPNEPQSGSYQRPRTTSAPSPSLPKSPNVQARKAEEQLKTAQAEEEMIQMKMASPEKVEEEEPERRREAATPPRELKRQENVEDDLLVSKQKADDPSVATATSPTTAISQPEEQVPKETATIELSPRAASLPSESGRSGSGSERQLKFAEDEGFTDNQPSTEQGKPADIVLASSAPQEAKAAQEDELAVAKADTEMDEAEVLPDVSADGTVIEHSSMDIDLPEQLATEQEQQDQAIEAANNPPSPLVEAILAENDISLDGTEATEEQTEEQIPTQIEENQGASIEQQASEDEEMEDEDDDEPQLDPAFVQMLGSLIEAEDSKGDMSTEGDLSLDIIKRNKAKAPVQLPLAVQKVYQGTDLLEVKEIVFANHLRLETFLIDEFQARDIQRGNHIFRLRAQYKELDQDWSVHCNKLEKIRTRQKRRQTAQAPPMTPSMEAPLGLPFLSATPATPSILAPSGRANRRNAASSLGYGDAARSEAEFLEILASLEDADMRDPNLRAMRTTATVPDMAIDAGEHGILQDYDDSSGLVADPFEHYGLNKKPDVWSEDEIATFCRRYALFPKEFGKIAASLPDKTTAQCVLFYYRSKKKINFRALVDKRSVNGKRKRKVGLGEKGTEDDGPPGDKKKGTSLLSNLKRSKEDEVEEDDYDEEPQTPGSAMAAVSAAVDAVALPAARALIDQLNSESDGYGSTRPASKMMLGEEYKHSNSRSNASKKAARFLSPPPSQHAANEGGAAPASDGAIAAAEALGVLAGLADPGSVLKGRTPLNGSTPGLGQKKKRKPSVSEPMTDLSFDGSTPKSAAGPAKRSRPHSSSYWSVADKNEFVRLLGVHGKNYQSIADGIPSKTAVQCKNFFQNNLKRLGLAQIVADVENRLQAKPDDDGQGQPDALRQIPSVYGKPNGHAAQPSAGFFSSPQTTTVERENIVPIARGGMNLHDLLDDAPDAEGGAHDPFRFEQRAEGQHAQGMPTASDVLEDSSTEDEAEPRRFATHMQQHVRRASDVLPLHRTISPQTLPPDPSLHHHQHERSLSYQYQQPPHSARTYGQQAHHARSISDSRRSPTFSLREPLSSPFPSVLSERRPGAYTSYTAPPNGSRYGTIPPSLPHSSRTWSPYDSPSYGQQAPLARDFYSSRSARYEDLPPLSARTYHPPSSYAAGRNLGLAQDGATYTKVPAGLPHQIQSPASYAHGSYFDGVSYPSHQRPPHHTSSARSSSASNVPHTLPSSAHGINGSGASTPTDPARSPVDHTSYYQRYENQPPLAHSRRNSAQQP